MDPNSRTTDTGPLTGNTQQPAESPHTAASIVHDVLDRAASAAGAEPGSVRPVVSRIPQAAQAPLADAVHAAASAADTLKDTTEAAMQQSDRMLDSATAYVRANPRRAIGIAFATGWFVGRFLL